jgi:hypothetical protein
MSLAEEQLVLSIGAQLDALQLMVTWVVGIAIVSFLVSMGGEEEVSLPFLSKSVPRNSAFLVLGSAFIYVLAASTVYFSRLSDLIAIVGHDDKAITALVTNSWWLNPFAYFGSDPMTRMRDELGYAAMYFVWWLGFGTLASVGHKNRWFFGLSLAVFFMFGFVAQFFMGRVLTQLDRQVPEWNISSGWLQLGWFSLDWWMVAGIVLGILAAVCLFCLAKRSKRQVKVELDAAL